MPKKTSVLIIDDEADILKALTDILAAENFAVLGAGTGEKGLALAAEKTPDVILLDLRLPDIDGYDVCKRLKADRKTSHIPIMMVSTRSKDTEKVVGLELGADDYLTKPFSDMELVARIRVMLRRKAGESKDGNQPAVLRSGIISIDVEGRHAKAGKEVLEITRKEFDLLLLFVGNPNKVLSRRFILESVWGYEVDSLQGTVDSHIKTLRKKLGAQSARIETVTGIGYRWSEE